MHTNLPLYPLRLERKLDQRLWGGHRLGDWLKLPKPVPTNLAESWQVYAKNRITNGHLAGTTLAGACQQYGSDLLGTLSIPRYGFDFPLLAKFLDANDRLSIQVHPDDDYAHTVEADSGFHGKTEAWYILEALPDAQLILGLDRPCDRQRFTEAVARGELESLVRFVPVKTGDVVFVPAGTLHAINAGILLFEIQQTSDLTYRVYDYHRRDVQGRLRELHLEKAIDVINFEPTDRVKVPSQLLAPGRELLVACPYFACEKVEITDSQVLSTRSSSFEIWTVIKGQVSLADEELDTAASLILPAALGRYEVAPVTPSSTLLRCYVPNLEMDLIAPLSKRGVSSRELAWTIFTES